MSRSVKVVPVVLLAFALAGCTTGVVAATNPTTPEPRSGAVAAGAVAAGAGAAGAGGSDVGADLGNGRPLVSNDGLMVRRRVVIAIYPGAGANLASLRKDLDRAAARAHTSLSMIPPGVLDPALLEPVAPKMTLALPPLEGLADARRLVGAASSEGQRASGVAAYKVASVLVHDLRFTVSSSTPAVLAAAIAREGILSDAFSGDFTTTLGSHEVDFTYTGPLLSDELVESVRNGIARQAHVIPTAVTISARLATGVGVDMAKEPVPAPAVTEAATAHHHGAEHSHP